MKTPPKNNIEWTDEVPCGGGHYYILHEGIVNEPLIVHIFRYSEQIFGAFITYYNITFGHISDKKSFTLPGIEKNELKAFKYKWSTMRVEDLEDKAA